MKRNKIYIIHLLLIGIVLIAGTFAWLTWRSNKTSLVLTVGDINNVQVVLKPYQINKEIIPVLTYTGEEYTEVSVVNNSSSRKKVNLYYYINSIDNELISSNFLYTIEKSTDNGISYTEYLSGNFSSAFNNGNLYIMEEIIPKNTNYKYRVYLWLDGSNSNQGSIQGKKFSGELRAEILNGSDVIVDLADGLIPITYDVVENNTTVKTIQSDEESWYDYDNQEWANAVLVSESSRSKYINTSGITVSETDILAYYVYVPRYRYKIWTTEESGSGSEQEIEIIFENISMPKYSGTQMGDYITHPAFTFGDVEVNGIWVGKFETSGTADSPLIKPDVQSLRSQNISTQFTTAKLFGTSAYGITANIDAHMMKNSEWGAVAYLSHSKYGVNREVYINNSSGYYTGRSGGNVGGSTEINMVYTNQTSTDSYNTYGFYTWDGYLLEYDTNTKSSTRDLSKVASTTGNITGIYDMSGGTWEYVMGVLADDDGNPRSGYSSSANSGYNGVIYDGGNNTRYTSGIDFPNVKYYDLYTSTNNLTACNGNACFGHDLSETINWYNDYTSFLSPSFPWLVRAGGYNDGHNAGLFYFDSNTAKTLSNIGFRSVLVKTQLYTDSILKGADPELNSGMIPIVYDNTTVKVANVYSEWYNYKNKQWANAVLVKESGTKTREYYQNNPGVEISEADILAYYVWIPRYKYKIWTTSNSSSGSEQEIEIIFESKDIAKSTGTQVGEYITHPAFTFGDVEINGIWVGKFEIGGTSDSPLIKPDVQSLRNQNISSQFTTAKLFETSIYGMNSKIDAHMIKNSEWGAAAYLSHSKYGVNREVYINNSSGFYTGRSGGNVGGSTEINTVYTDQTSTAKYNTYGFYTWDGYLLEYDTNTKSSTRDLSKVASTTGNITGIYDMSGGSFEYVMGVLADDDGNPRSGNNLSTNSGFNGTLNDGTLYTEGIDFPNAKYYDLYTTTNLSSNSSSLSLMACNDGICYGSGLSEANNWYDDYSYFISGSNPWFNRGAGYNSGIYAGLFSANDYSGISTNILSSRSVLIVLS